MAKSLSRGFLAVILTATLSVSVFARTAEYIDSSRTAPQTAAANPAYCLALHNVGQMVFGVNNSGTIGMNYSLSGTRGCFTGERVPAFEYPKGSRTTYLFGAAFWIGAIVGRDTLVSIGQDGWAVSDAEFHPDEPPLGNMIYRSTIDPSKPEFDGAISEQDFIAVYTDTFTTGVGGINADEVDGRQHRPLNIEVTQRSFAWSYSYAEDFVVFDFAIRNIGLQRLRRVYMGLYVDADVHSEAIDGQIGAQDDICGFLHGTRASYLPSACFDDASVDTMDVVNLAWIADSDGDLRAIPGQEVPDITGMRIVRTPNPDSLKVSFNWWVSNGDATIDFGPQTRAKVRQLEHGGMGTPIGDRNKYYFMSNGEFDYDQVFTANIQPTDTLWLPPNEQLKRQLSRGFDTRYLLSFGPFDIESGQTLPLSFAYVGGQDLHRDRDNQLNNLVREYKPIAYYEGLDFSDLGKNATWAEWIYDNPGVDTDSDGYAGVFDTCYLGGDSTPVLDSMFDTIGDSFIIDTVAWDYENDSVIPRKGDGVPDFRGANPPPAPKVWVIPREGAITVRWNGARSETTVDNFSQALDFEGYRVYAGRDERRSSYSVLQSYDFENYNKWVWDDSVVIGGNLGGFVLRERPYTLQELRCWYADSCGDTEWDPLDHPRTNPFVFEGTWGDSVFYFAPQDFNRSILADSAGDPNATTQIMKRDPDAMEPPLDWVQDTTLIPDTLRDSFLTYDGYFRYYEYEYTIENLLPTVPYWINVTAFDYGSPLSGLPSLETSPTVLPAVTYALPSVESVQAEDLKVYVYPNPYRLDAGYRASGFEGLAEQDRPDDRVRRIHFANLPPKCTINIYSIDGDLVRQIEHDVPPSDPLANHDTWDLITRNTQLVVSGLYYWVVETPDGETQVGKLVIIM